MHWNQNNGHNPSCMEQARKNNAKKQPRLRYWLYCLWCLSYPGRGLKSIFGGLIVIIDLAVLMSSHNYALPETHRNII